MADDGGKVDFKALRAKFGQEPVIMSSRPGGLKPKFGGPSPSKLNDSSNNNEVPNTDSNKSPLVPKKEETSPKVNLSEITNRKTSLKIVPNKRSSQLTIPEAFQKDDTQKKPLPPKPKLAMKPNVAPKNVISNGNKPDLGVKPVNIISSKPPVPKTPLKPQTGAAQKQEAAKMLSNILANKIPTKTETEKIISKENEENPSLKSSSNSEILPDEQKHLNEEEHADKQELFVSGSKKFRVKELPPLSELGRAPGKEPKPKNVDLSKYSINGNQTASNHAARRLPSIPKERPPLPPTPVDAEEPEEEYDDVENLQRKQRAASVISEYTEDEERGGKVVSGDFDDIYEDMDTSDPTNVTPRRPVVKPAEESEEEFEEYDDNIMNISKASQNGNESDGSVYEDLDDHTTKPDIKQKTEEELKKEEEKKKMLEQKKQEQELRAKKRAEEQEKREQEKKEKEEERKKERDIKLREKERLKKYQKEQKLFKKFKMDGSETVIQVGTAMEPQKKTDKNLGLETGAKVFVIRLDNNPSGKWLAKSLDGSIGYVDSNNIEVDADSIKNSMENALDNYGGSIGSTGTGASSEVSGTGSSNSAEEYMNMEGTCPAEPEEDLYEETG